MEKLSWSKKIPYFGKWWHQEAIVITNERTPHFVITKGSRTRRPFSLWVKCYELGKSEKFIGNFKTLTKAKKVAQFIYEG